MRCAGNLDKGKQEKDIVTLLCILLSIAVIAGTVAACRLKKPNIVVNDVSTGEMADFEWQYVGQGECFEIDGKEITVEKAWVKDTSGLKRISEDKKLIAVTVWMKQADKKGGYGTSDKDPGAGISEAESDASYGTDVNWGKSSLIYMWDGTSCRMPFDENDMSHIIYGGRFSVEEFTEEEILTGYEYHYCDNDGEKGAFYFLADKRAAEICISFNEWDSDFALRKRISVILPLEEDNT